MWIVADGNEVVDLTGMRKMRIREGATNRCELLAIYNEGPDESLTTGSLEHCRRQFDGIRIAYQAGARIYAITNQEELPCKQLPSSRADIKAKTSS